jgi:dihydroorotase
MSINPAKILGISSGIKVGSIADIVIVDLYEEYVVDKDKFKSKGRNTPFHGMRLKGVVEYTIVEGEIKYKKDRKTEKVEV